MDDTAWQLSLAADAEFGRGPSMMMNLGGPRPIFTLHARRS